MGSAPGSYESTWQGSRPSLQNQRKRGPTSTLKVDQELNGQEGAVE